MKLHSINQAQRLYVMPCGAGFTCYGFDVLDRKARAVAAWAEFPAPSAGTGTAEHFAQCADIMTAGQFVATKRGERCPAELTPELVPHEGRRVEVTRPDGTRERFNVGKSTGWLPCHLAIPNRRSRGGPAVYFPAGSTVRAVQA